MFTGLYDTPQNKNKEHFYLRDEALSQFKGHNNALTNLDCLPSKAIKQKKSEKKTEKKKRDTVVGKTVSKWAACNVRQSIQCELCLKPRCLFSKSNISKENMQELETTEEVNQYICGHLLFPIESNHCLKDTIVQRINLTCEDAVEREYYNPVDSKRSYFQTEIICALCTSKDNLLHQVQLENLNVTEGYPCLPLCQSCHDSGLTPARNGQKPRQNHLKKQNQKLNNKRKALTIEDNDGTKKKSAYDVSATCKK